MGLPSSAFADSNRGTFFVQAAPLGGTIITGDGSEATYHADLDAGVHFGPNHEGGAIGLHQAFLFGSATKAGSTQVRGGYDIAIQVGNRMELVLSPFAKAGIAYSFDGGDPLFAGGLGFEGRFFPIADNGFFAMAKPLDVDVWTEGNVVLVPITFSAGAGFAF